MAIALSSVASIDFLAASIASISRSVSESLLAVLIAIILNLAASLIDLAAFIDGLAALTASDPALDAISASGDWSFMRLSLFVSLWETICCLVDAVLWALAASLFVS